LRIIYLNGGVMPSKHANSVQIAKMCEAFALNGHRLHLIARAGTEPASRIFEIYGVRPVFEAETVKLVGARGTRTAIFLMRVLSRVRAPPRPDLFYARDPLMLAAVSHLGRPMIYESHYMPPVGSFRFRLLNWLFRQPNFVRLVCTTTTTRDDFRRHFPQLPADAVLAAPNAAADPQADAPELAAWPGREGRLQVGFVGRPFPGKGIETIVAAASALADVDFHVVGAERDDLGWLEAPIPPNLHLHGYREHSALPAYYCRFDVAVAPYGAKVFNASGIESASVTSPLKVLEYMAAGLPIVTSDLPGVREIAEHQRSALLVAPGDEEAFVAAVVALRDDPDLRARLAQGARAHFLAQHDVRSRAERVIAGVAGESAV
jgi:glycosyltransferase involved in cell wall biosynthesis